MTQIMNVGTKVHWTHVNKSKYVLSMRRREGVVEEIKGDMAIVKCGGRRVEVALKRLRTEDQESQVTEFTKAMFEVNRSKTE